MGNADRLHRRTTPRRFLAAATTALAIGGVTACSDSAGPEEGATLDDLTELEDQVSELGDRVGQLENGLARGGDGPQEEPFSADGSGEVSDFEARFLEDPAVNIGETVTISATVSDVVPTLAVGEVFRVGGDPGREIDVLAPGASFDLSVNDVVEVTGEVVVVEESRFEEDFGISAEALFEDPEGYFEADQVALSASEVRLLEDEPANEFPTD